MSKSRLWPRMRPQRPAFNSLNIFENEVMLHGKFQPPNFNNVAVHTYVINRNTDIKGVWNIFLDYFVACCNQWILRPLCFVFCLPYLGVSPAHASHSQAYFSLNRDTEEVTMERFLITIFLVYTCLTLSQSGLAQGNWENRYFYSNCLLLYVPVFGHFKMFFFFTKSNANKKCKWNITVGISYKIDADN